MSESYLYDETGQRIRKTSSGVSTFYPFAGYEQKSGQAAAKHYSFGRRFVAVRGPAGLFFLFQDQLSSTVYATDANGVKQAERGYYDFGVTRFSEGYIPTDYHFTGQREDGTGLYYYNSRFYDPYLGNFISPDTIVPDPTRLIDYNRYLYARGNPVKYNDPSGHCAISEGEDGQEYIAKWDCTVDDFAKLSWEDRKRWMELFMQETDTPWFQNILGILDYFSSDSDFSPLDGWASVADAAVLQAINDGYLLHEPNINGGRAIGPSGPGSASQRWKAFFDVATAPESDARRLWGIAEQAGVDYGMQQAAPLLSNGGLIVQAKAAAFVELGNVYRAMIANEVQSNPIVAGAERTGFTPLDPRTQMSRSFVAGVAGAYVPARAPSIANSEICRQTFVCGAP